MAAWTDPPDRNTGDIITEPQWEALLGPNGSLAKLKEWVEKLLDTTTGEQKSEVGDESSRRIAFFTMG